MDISQFSEKYIPLIKQHIMPIFLGIIGLGFVGYGLIQLLGVQRDSSEITFESGQQTANAETKSTHKMIVVDVEGAVFKPGIQKLPEGSRVQDALVAAGGMSEKADRMKVSRGMNLAAKVIDGGKVYIPFEGEAASVSVGQVAGVSESSTGEASALININSASESELDTLSGVGPATAQKIIANRPYASVEELLSKKSVGKSVFEKIKNQLSVD